MTAKVSKSGRQNTGSKPKKIAGHASDAGRRVRLKNAVEASEIVVGLQRHGVSQTVIAEVTLVDPRSVHSWKAGASPRRPKYDRLATLRDVVTILDDSLTHRGISQWLDARNRYLDGARPIEILAEGRLDEVIQAATSYAEGSYL